MSEPIEPFKIDVTVEACRANSEDHDVLRRLRVGITRTDDDNCRREEVGHLNDWITGDDNFARPRSPGDSSNPDALALAPVASEIVASHQRDGVTCAALLDRITLVERR